MFPVTVAPCAFVSKVAGVNTLPFRHQGHTVFRRNLCAVRGLVAAVPDAKNDPSLGRAVYLHPEITSMPSASHVERPNGLFYRCHLAIESIDLFILLDRIEQMH